VARDESINLSVCEICGCVAQERESSDAAEVEMPMVSRSLPSIGGTDKQRSQKQHKRRDQKRRGAANGVRNLVKEESTFARMEATQKQQLSLFDSSNVHAETRLTEVCIATEALGRPNNRRTAVLFDVLLGLCRGKGSTTMVQVCTELAHAIYSNADEMHRGDIYDMPFESLMNFGQPYHELCHQMQPELTESKRQLALWRDKRADMETTLRANQMVLKMAITAWQKVVLSIILSEWKLFVEMKKTRYRKFKTVRKKIWFEGWRKRCVQDKLMGYLTHGTALEAHREKAGRAAESGPKGKAQGEKGASANAIDGLMSDMMCVAPLQDLELDDKKLLTRGTELLSFDRKKKFLVALCGMTSADKDKLVVAMRHTQGKPDQLKQLLECIVTLDESKRLFLVQMMSAPASECASHLETISKLNQYGDNAGAGYMSLMNDVAERTEDEYDEDEPEQLKEHNPHVMALSNAFADMPQEHSLQLLTLMHRLAPSEQDGEAASSHGLPSCSEKSRNDLILGLSKLQPEAKKQVVHELSTAPAHHLPTLAKMLASTELQAVLRAAKVPEDGRSALRTLAVGMTETDHFSFFEMLSVLPENSLSKYCTRLALMVSNGDEVGMGRMRSALHGLSAANMQELLASTSDMTDRDADVTMQLLSTGAFEAHAGITRWGMVERLMGMSAKERWDALQALQSAGVGDDAYFSGVLAEMTQGNKHRVEKAMDHVGPSKYGMLVMSCNEADLSLLSKRACVQLIADIELQARESNVEGQDVVQISELIEVLVSTPARHRGAFLNALCGSDPEHRASFLEKAAKGAGNGDGQKPFLQSYVDLIDGLPTNGKDALLLAAVVGASSAVSPAAGIVDDHFVAAAGGLPFEQKLGIGYAMEALGGRFSCTVEDMEQGHRTLEQRGGAHVNVTTGGAGREQRKGGVRRGSVVNIEQDSSSIGLRARLLCIVQNVALLAAPGTDEDDEDKNPSRVGGLADSRLLLGLVAKQVEQQSETFIKECGEDGVQSKHDLSVEQQDAVVVSAVMGVLEDLEDDEIGEDGLTGIERMIGGYKKALAAEAKERMQSCFGAAADSEWAEGAMGLISEGPPPGIFSGSVEDQQNLALLMSSFPPGSQEQQQAAALLAMLAGKDGAEGSAGAATFLAVSAALGSDEERAAFVAALSGMSEEERTALLAAMEGMSAAEAAAFAASLGTMSASERQEMIDKMLTGAVGEDGKIDLAKLRGSMNGVSDKYYSKVQAAQRARNQNGGGDGSGNGGSGNGGDGAGGRGGDGSAGGAQGGANFGRNGGKSVRNIATQTESKASSALLRKGSENGSGDGDGDGGGVVERRPVYLDTKGHQIMMWGGVGMKKGEASKKTIKSMQTIISEFYCKKIVADAIDDREHHMRETLAEFVVSWLSTKYGKRKLVDQQLRGIVQATFDNRELSKRIQLFGRLAGVFGPFDRVEGDLVLEVLASLGPPDKVKKILDYGEGKSQIPGHQALKLIKRVFPLKFSDVADGQMGREESESKEDPDEEEDYTFNHYTASFNHVICLDWELRDALTAQINELATNGAVTTLLGGIEDKVVADSTRRGSCMRAKGKNVDMHMKVDLDLLISLFLDVFSLQNKREARRLQEIFGEFDADGDGLLDFDEFSEMMKSCRMVEDAEAEISPRLLERIFREASEFDNDDGEEDYAINQREFMHMARLCQLNGIVVKAAKRVVK
jgi:hypothetical protein